MDILIGYSSALSYWRTAGVGFLRDTRMRRSATKRAQAVLEQDEKPKLAGGGRRPGGCTLPLEVLVGSDRARTETAQVVSSTWGNPLPECSFVDAGEGFLLSAPEFCFLQMANRVSLVNLIQIGFELCGTYSLGLDGPAVRRSAPLTSVARLQALVGAAANVYGSKKARRALRYVQEGSASPMETALALMLCLPYGMGGYGLEEPSLNYRVEVPRRLRKLADRTYCECDLCWPDAKLAVEYDSRLYHIDPDRQESDARRRNTLITLGFTVVTVSRGQLMDGAAFNRLAHQLAKCTGKRLRYQDPEFTQKHYGLRAQLFSTTGERTS